eukprot:2907421-Prymnesium_polylepis.1
MVPLPSVPPPLAPPPLAPPPLAPPSAPPVRPPDAPPPRRPPGLPPKPPPKSPPCPPPPAPPPPASIPVSPPRAPPPLRPLSDLLADATSISASNDVRDRPCTPSRPRTLTPFARRTQPAAILSCRVIETLTRPQTAATAEHLLVELSALLGASVSPSSGLQLNLPPPPPLAALSNDMVRELIGVLAASLRPPSGQGGVGFNHTNSTD